MDIRTAIWEAIKSCGGPVSFDEDGTNYQFSACIQPISYGAQASGQPEQTRFGTADSKQFVYYGPLKNGGELVEEGTVLKQGEQVYVVQLCRDFCWKGKAVFRWAALIKQEDFDGTVYEN